MADLAYDASDPASSEPAGIALQQANRPASSDDKEKLRVFISYSRDDLKFADQLDAALGACGFECLIDRHDISGGEDWKARLGNLIRQADTVVFVLSPSSARSPICAGEVEEATRLNKRIIPIVCRPLEGVSPPPRLRERNYIFFYDDPKAAPGEGFGTGLAGLIAALNTDLDWLRDHTRYLQRAIEWDTGGRPADRLLSGDDITEAKAWVARRPKGAPEPTTLHLDFIHASEEEAKARLSEQRKQLEEMAAAHDERERALREAEEAQRKRATMARIRNIALAAVSILAVLAGGMALYSVQQQKIAEEQKAAAEEQREQADRILGGATGLIRGLADAALDRMDLNSKKQVFAVLKLGADHGDATSISTLGWVYLTGFGVEQDYVKARELFERAADKGEPTTAMTNLGWLYKLGQGGEQDYAKARDWFEKAADKGDTDGMYSLGLLYRDGQGVAQDYAKARELFESAADKGNENAMNNLGALYHNGQGVAQDYAKAREWYEKGADKGDPDATANLGLLYDNGQGVTQDYAKAREWYEKAAAKGNASAKRALEKLPIREAVTAGRYDEALRLEETLAAKVEAEETQRDGKPGEQAASVLNEVVWYALFGKEFTKALTVADHAHTLFPNNLLIETNRAHALMFMGHDEEAKGLYLAHKGEPVSHGDNELWEQAIADDFAEFRKAGMTSPMMAAIEKELGISR
jgi:TPR repeat protein